MIFDFVEPPPQNRGCTSFEIFSLIKKCLLWKRTDKTGTGRLTDKTRIETRIVIDDLISIEKISVLIMEMKILNVITGEETAIITDRIMETTMDRK